MTPLLTAGLGLKPQHYDEALHCTASGLWWEVHPENYLADGGPRLAWLKPSGRAHPVSLHGVSLSLAADAPPDAEHLQRLAQLARRIEPALVSEHLAWSAWRGRYHPTCCRFRARTRRWHALQPTSHHAGRPGPHHCHREPHALPAHRRPRLV
jgi:uncharacterized protein (UPF0276 family)